MSRGCNIFVNGRVAAWSPDIEAPYIYQRIRTEGDKPLHLKEHCLLLQQDSERLFGKSFEVEPDCIAETITSLLRLDNYSPLRSHIVEIRVYESMDYAVMAVETSLYQGLELRAIRPKAMVCQAYSVLPDIPTSASKAQTELLRRHAERYGCAVAICTTADGIITEIDGAAVMAVIDRKIVIQPGKESVEKQQIIERLRAGRREPVQIREITIEELRRAEEIFYVDVRGITSVSEIEGEILSDFVANAAEVAPQNIEDIDIIA